jgi:hypothetical protein
VALDHQTVRDSRLADVIPGPRAAEPPSGELPWTDPRPFPPGTHPRSEYWNHETASWTSRAPFPGPRLGD